MGQLESNPATADPQPRPAAQTHPTERPAQLLAAPVPTTPTLLLTPPHRPIQPPTHLRPPKRDINHQFTVALDPDTQLYYRLRLYTGKRVTSAQSRERRCKERKGNSRAWIRSCLLSKDPLRLRSVDSKSLLVETI